MIIFIVLTIIVFAFLLFRWMGKSQMGTLTLFLSTYSKSVEEGRARKDAYRAALERIEHRYPIGSLSEEEKERVLEVFARFPDARDVKLLVREALVQQNADFLREPYISNLERVGREKGISVE